MAQPPPQFIVKQQVLPQQQQQQQQLHQLLTQQQQQMVVKEKLKELGQGPFTPEQQKQREALFAYLKENISGTPTTIVQPIGQLSQPIHTTIVDPQQQQAQQQQAAAAQQTSQQSQILDKRALQELVKEVDPAEQLDEDVEDMLLQIADDFIENVVNASCQLAKHRKSNILEAKDVQFHLERNYNIWVPGFSTDELKTYKKSVATEAHKQVILLPRLQLIKKSTSKPGDGK